MSRLLLLAPLAIEARALRRGLAARPRATQGGGDASRIVRTGMGPEAATLAATRLPAQAGNDALVVVAGFCGGLRPDVRTGDVIVATEVRGPDGVLHMPGAREVAGALRAAGLTVHLGPLVSSAHLAFGRSRSQLGADGCLGVDMESYWLLHGCGPPVAVVRTVSDTAGERLLGGMLPFGWLRAYRSLTRVAAALSV